MSPAGPDVSRKTTRVVLAWTLGLYGAPLLADLFGSGRRGPFAYAAADSFYYLTVARNVAEHGRVSFDQQHLTNGFHPLWQYVLVAVAVVEKWLGFGALALLHSANLICLLLVALTIYLLGRALTIARGRLSALFVALPVGYFSMIAGLWWIGVGSVCIRASAPAEGWRPLVGTLWLQTNAMETPLLLASYASMILLLVRHAAGWTPRHGVLLGLAGLGVSLARLDHAVFPLVTLAALLAVRGAGRARTRAVATALGIVVAGLLLYVLSNRIFFEAWLPVSGAAKTTFPRITLESWRALGGLLDGANGLKENARVLGLFGPPLAILVYLVARARRGLRRLSRYETAADRLDFALATGGLGALVLAGYDIHFVPLMQQGTWYFPLSMLLVSLIVVREAEGWLPRRAALPVGALATLVVLACFAFLHRDAAYHREMSVFFHESAPRIVARYAGEAFPGIASDEDGLLAFATGLPTMNMRRLALDAQAAATRSAGELLDLAYDRGYTRYSVGPQYLGTEHTAGAEEQVARIGERKLNEGLRPAQRYRATVDYRDPTVLILRLAREPLEATPPRR